MKNLVITVFVTFKYINLIFTGRQPGDKLTFCPFYSHEI